MTARTAGAHILAAAAPAGRQESSCEQAAAAARQRAGRYPAARFHERRQPTHSSSTVPSMRWNYDKFGASLNNSCWMRSSVATGPPQRPTGAVDTSNWQARRVIGSDFLMATERLFGNVGCESRNQSGRPLPPYHSGTAEKRRQKLTTQIRNRSCTQRRKRQRHPENAGPE
jgi:hypothetical protein